MRAVFFCAMSFLALFVSASQAYAAEIDWAEQFSRQFSASDYQLLSAGEEALPVLVDEPTVSLSRGVAVIFASVGQHLLPITEGQRIAKELNHLGWQTIVVPPLHLAALSDPEMDTDRAALPHQSFMGETADFIAMEQQLFSRMLSIAELANTYPGFQLWIAPGMTAPLLLNLTADGRIASPDNLVSVAPFWPSPKRNDEIPQWIADSQFPVLDIALDEANKWTQQTKHERQYAVNRSLKLHYRQRQLTQSQLAVNDNMSVNASDNHWLTKEVQGWTQYLGW